MNGNYCFVELLVKRLQLIIITYLFIYLHKGCTIAVHKQTLQCMYPLVLELRNDQKFSPLQKFNIVIVLHL